MRHSAVVPPVNPVSPAGQDNQSKDRQRRRSARSDEVKQVASDNDLGRPIVEEDAERIASQSKATRDVRRARKRAVQPA